MEETETVWTEVLILGVGMLREWEHFASDQKVLPPLPPG
jgi:hypothetical protein